MGRFPDLDNDLVGQVQHAVPRPPPLGLFAAVERCCDGTAMAASVCGIR